MEKTFSLGLGIIHEEKGELRAFLPPFVEKMSRFYKEIILEDGYGSSLGFESYAYSKPGNVRFSSAEDVYLQDYVLVLRFPSNKYLKMMKPGGCLISMCHFPTRPKRRRYLSDRNIEAISLDSIVDDNGQRLVENLRSVAWNGCEIAFQVIHKIWPKPGIKSTSRQPLRATLLGSGGVGIHAVQAAIRYGDPALWQTYAAEGIPGNIIRVVDYDLTPHETEVKKLLKNTPLLIDATQRKDPSAVVIPNHLLRFLPPHAVILDLSVDPYDFRHKPYEIKGIEGIPQGNLDQYIFSPEDPAWDKVSSKVNTENRRWVVSCYSWPGIHPRSCMLRYGNQLSPLLRRLAVAGGKDAINPGGQYHDRALARGMLKYWGTN
jgi:alanine dehydrogenase